MDEFYTFTYEDIYLGTIKFECDGPADNASSKMTGILTRVIPDQKRGKRKRRKRPFEEDEIAGPESTFQQAYTRDKQNDCERSTVNLPDQNTQELPIKRARYGSDEKTMTNSHKTGCFRNIFQILRKKLGRRRRETDQANSDAASNDESTSSEKGEEDIPSRGDVIDKCLKIVGYRYAVTGPILNSCSKVTTTVRLDVSRVNRLNQGLTLLKEEELTDYCSDTVHLKREKISTANWRSERQSSDEETLPKKPKPKPSRSNDQRNEFDEDKVPEVIKGNRQLGKYYYMRRSLFEKYDDGIQLDAESWYSVTPESIARHIAERCTCDTILDGFCGVGGNAIQFAFTCTNVIAVDIDPEKIKMAKHNAAIYGLAGKIDFRVGDFFELAPKIAAEYKKIDVVFLSPPWGGVNYLRGGKFPLSRILPKHGKELFEFAQTISKAVAYYLPRTINIAEAVGLCGPGNVMEIQQNMLKGKLRALTCYFDELARFDYLTDSDEAVAEAKPDDDDDDATSKLKPLAYDDVILGGNTDISLDDW